MKKNIKIIAWAMIVAISMFTILEISNKNLEIQQVKAELLKAKEPSKVEIQKAGLIKLEEQWRKTEEAIYQLQALKPRIESKIQNLRKEIINTNPKIKKVEEVKK